MRLVHGILIAASSVIVSASLCLGKYKFVKTQLISILCDLTLVQVLLSKGHPEILEKLEIEILCQPLFAIRKYVFPVVPVNVI